MSDSHDLIAIGPHGVYAICSDDGDAFGRVIADHFTR